MSRPSKGALPPRRRPGPASNAEPKTSERADPDTAWQMPPVPNTALTTEPVPVARDETTSAAPAAAPPQPAPVPRRRPAWPTSALRGRELASKNRAAAVLGSILIVLLAAFIVEAVSPSWLAGLRNVASPRGAGVVPTTTSTTPSSTVPRNGPSGSGAPVLYSLTPSSAPSGATITIVGDGLFSSNHTVIARFDGSVSSTHCPTTHRCLVVVPSRPKGSGTVTVRVSTNAGQSNALSFQYS